MKLFRLTMLVLLLNGCTSVSYTDGTKTLSIVDFHPGGEALDLTAGLDNVGELAVNRNVADSQGLTDSITEAVKAAINPASVFVPQ